MFKSDRVLLVALLLICILMLLAGCKQVPATQEPLATTPPPVIESSATPLPVVQRLVLVDAQGSAAPELVTVLTEFASSNALAFQSMQSLDQLPLAPKTRIVVFLQAPANLEELVSAVPQTHFIVIGDIDPNGNANLSVIKSKAEDVAFMGGYLTTIISWDWRSGGLIPLDTPLGASYRDAFENGGRYVCGQCTSTYAPFFYFPLIVEESSQAGVAGWQTQVNALVEYFVKTVYVDPAAALPEVLDMLNVQGMAMIGTEGTPSAERFIALLGVDYLPALQQLLPQVLNGSGGNVVWAQVKIASYTDETLITPAKIDLFNRTAADVSAGLIIPLSIQ